jgi:hypothetical protein
LLLFVGIAKGIAFLISSSDNSFLACSDAADYLMLILYSANFLNSFISLIAFE